MKDRTAVIGIDIGGTKIAAALFSEDGQIIRREIRQLDGREGDQVGELVVQLANDMLQEAGKKSYLVRAIGACVPGIYYPTKKTVWAPNISGWTDYLLYEDLAKGIRDASVHIAIESDRSCYILGEVWKGNAKGCKNAIFIAVGTSGKSEKY